MHKNNSYDLRDKKQVLLFQLLALSQARRHKPKQALKCAFAAQQIVSELDETEERNLDYLVAVNTLTAYLLLSMGKPHEAMEFTLISERIIFRVVESTVAEAPSPLVKLEDNNLP